MAETPNVNNTGAQTQEANGDAAAGPGPSSVPPTATADNATHAGSAAAGPDVTAQLMKMLIAQQQTMQAQQQQAIQAHQARANTSKQIADPPKFNGKSSEDLELWLLHIEELFSADAAERDAPDSRFVDMVVPFLGTEAMSWYREFKTTLEESPRNIPTTLHDATMHAQRFEDARGTRRGDVKDLPSTSDKKQGKSGSEFTPRGATSKTKARTPIVCHNCHHPGHLVPACPERGYTVVPKN
ncbi:hypothetical protein PInf_021525 [Phytophthora infestans]|nr:hypothetical protein PInf_021525 [Phytophthora infestans]